MTLLGEFKGIDVEARVWDLDPSAARVDTIDVALRNKLAGSLTYLAEATCLDASHHAMLVSIEDRLRSGPVSPWVFCLYSKLVAELAKPSSSDVSGDFTGIGQAAVLPAESGVVALRAPIIPEPWWDHAQLLFDTDRKRPFRPKAPSGDASALCRQDIEAGLALLAQADPVWHQEVRSLIKLIVLSAPTSPHLDAQFNGASTFFFWGAALINGDIRRSSISMIDLLVHESSHLLLFGISADGALLKNSGHERHQSPLRHDTRPIDGIFHACFVATRVHLALSRMLASGALSDEEAKRAIDRAQSNGHAARNALDELDRYAKPTELGTKVLKTLRAYWTATPAN